MVCQIYAGVQHLFDDVCSVLYGGRMVRGAMLTGDKRVVPSPPEFCKFFFSLFLLEIVNILSIITYFSVITPTLDPPLR